MGAQIGGDLRLRAPRSISSRKCIIMMYSAGMVQSASSSNSQYPSALCRAINASRAAAMARSNTVDTVLVSVCDTMSPRALIPSSGRGDGFPAMPLNLRNSRRSAGARVPAHARSADVELRRVARAAGRGQPGRTGAAAASHCARDRSVSNRVMVTARTRNLHLRAGGEAGIGGRSSATSAPRARSPTGRSGGCRSLRPGINKV